MNKAAPFILQRYQFGWVAKPSEKKRYTIQLIDSQEVKNKDERHKNRFRRFLVRLRSD